MRLEYGRFDQVLREIYTEPATCECNRHAPFRDTPLTPAQMADILETPEWSGSQALSVFGITTTYDPKAVIGSVPIEQLRDKRSRNYMPLREDGHPESVAGALVASNKVYLNPTAPAPLRSLIHELMHERLGHGAWIGQKVLSFIQDVMEAQTEVGTILVLDALGLDHHIPASRGYVGLHCPLPLPFFLQDDAKVAAGAIISAGMVVR